MWPPPRARPGGFPIGEDRLAAYSRAGLRGRHPKMPRRSGKTEMITATATQSELDAVTMRVDANPSPGRQPSAPAAAPSRPPLTEARTNTSGSLSASRAPAPRT
jgi:hypothetical protein